MNKSILGKILSKLGPFGVLLFALFGVFFAPVMIFMHIIHQRVAEIKLNNKKIEQMLYNLSNNFTRMELASDELGMISIDIHGENPFQLYFVFHGRSVIYASKESEIVVKFAEMAHGEDYQKVIKSIFLHVLDLEFTDFTARPVKLNKSHPLYQITLPVTKVPAVAPFSLSILRSVSLISTLVVVMSGFANDSGILMFVGMIYLLFTIITFNATVKSGRISYT